MAVNSKANEVWKDVVGYEGFYEVSNLGRIRNAWTSAQPTA